MSYIRFGPPSRSTDPFFHNQRRNPCAPPSSYRGPCGPSATEAFFNPLAEFFSGLEKELTSPASKPSQPKRQTINPHFDVLETEDAYILEGELPGVSDKRSIDIEFSDAQTLIVKGSIIRQKQSSSAQTSTQQDIDELVASEVSDVTSQDTIPSDTVTKSPGSPARSLAPTVEETIDESESGSENDFEVVDSPSRPSSKARGKAPEKVLESKPEPAEKPPTPIVEAPVEITKSAEPVKPAEKSNTKYWISERIVGDFARSFTFQSLIDQDGVKASLEHGILEITVPKRQPYVRRVQIQ